MKLPIQCLLIRQGGTKVELEGSTYHFHPANDPAGQGRHICFVDNKAHAQRFMQIPEAYALADDAEEVGLTTGAPVIATTGNPAPASVDQADTGAPPAQATTVAAGVSLEPGPVTLVPPQGDDAQAAAGSTVPVPQPDSPTTTTTLPTEEELGAMTLDALRAQAEAELGRKPSQKAKEALLIAQILAVRADKNPA